MRACTTRRRMWSRIHRSAARVRATVAAFVAQTVDTLIFVTIAFYGKFPLLPVIGGQLAAKALVWGLATRSTLRVDVIKDRSTLSREVEGGLDSLRHDLGDLGHVVPCHQ